MFRLAHVPLLKVHLSVALFHALQTLFCSLNVSLNAWVGVGPLRRVGKLRTVYEKEWIEYLLLA